MAEPAKLDPRGDRLPLEVEHGVDWLDFYPPRPPLEGSPDQSRVVSIHDDKLVTVLDVCVLKRDSTHSPFLLPPRQHLLNLLDLVREMIRYQD